MSDTDTQPRIWRSGNNFMAEIRGKFVSSPSYDSLAEQLGLETGKAAREQAERDRREAEQAVRQVAADKIPDLEVAATAADHDRQAAREAFAAAVASDPVLAAYGELLAAHNRHRAARQQVSNAQAEAQGRMPFSGGGIAAPRLLDAIEDAIGAPTGTTDLSMHGSTALDGGPR